jgi:hypothetical protein
MPIARVESRLREVLVTRVGQGFLTAVSRTESAASIG